MVKSKIFDQGILELFLYASNKKASTLLCNTYTALGKSFSVKTVPKTYNQPKVSILAFINTSLDAQTYECVRTLSVAP